MTAYAKRTVRSYPFPQANSSSRILDTLDLVCRGPIDDAGVGETFGISERQGAYYANGAAFLGLVRNSGGYWRPTTEGSRIAEMSNDTSRQLAIGALVIALPVFDRAAEHLSILEEMPEVDEIADWVRSSSPELNDVTADRRAATVHAWVSSVWSETPDLIRAISIGATKSADPDAGMAFAA